MMAQRPWRIRIDTGGTFTDCVAVDPEGHPRRAKVLSHGALRGGVVSANGPRLRLELSESLPRGFLIGWVLSDLEGGRVHRIVDHEGADVLIEVEEGASVPQPRAAIELRSGEEAPLLAARLVTGTPRGAPLPPVEMRLATTRGTNALLERSGARTALFVTEGFEDILEIGTQQRPDLFSLDIVRPRPLPEKTVGVRGRLGSDGEVLEDLDESAVRAAARGLYAEGFRCAAISLLHGHVNPVHEKWLESILREEGMTTVARSSDVSPFLGLLRRTATTVVDAYLGPVIGGYLGAVEEGLRAGGASLHVMTSAGGLMRTGSFRPKDSLLSGPAGGVVGAATAGRSAGFDRIIAFDMGGTSTDVSRFDGDYSYVFEHTVGGIELGAPALAIETVAAGGGSICRVEHGRLVVGPESAGARPGPACYGAGGPLTITDVNVLLGRLAPERFPIPIDVARAEERLTEIARDLGADGGRVPRREELLEGLLQIADERMADAIRGISVREGVDPAGFTLVAFGGAGGQHACRVADLLSIESVLVPADAGLLSAVGLGHAVLERFAQREILRPLSEVADGFDAMLRELEDRARRKLAEEGTKSGGDGDGVDAVRRIIEVRYVGQDAVIEIEARSAEEIAGRFERRYREIFAHLPKGREIEIVSARVIVRSRRDPAPVREMRKDSGDRGPTKTRRSFFDGRWVEVALIDERETGGGKAFEGPLLIEQRHSMIVVGPGWTARGSGDGGVLLKKTGTPRRSGGDQPPVRPEAVELELMSRRFGSIAEEMGAMLQRTAISTNIKEREDFSCTLLDAEGRLVVNAPHIPVHLGAMGLCVRSLIERFGMGEGDVVVTNHPSFGGSHLPDVTLVAPVHLDGRRLGHVACRAHHAEIGGIRPGSMPPDAKTLAEEGVVLAPTRLVEGGRVWWEGVERLLMEGPYPTRGLDDNRADLHAMLAAVVRGRDALLRLAAAVGVDHVERYMDGLRALAARQVRQAFSGLGDGEYEGRQELDDGSPLVARLTVSGDRATLDFTGSAGVHPGSLNATPAIVRSVVMYVMRLLVDVDLPLNEGLLDPIELIVPVGILDPPFVDDPARCPAVVGGNVETSQRLTDTLLEALGLAACSQGTMNNLSFGNDAFGYYETVGGGAGATAERDGASGVHTHMTNTRITDPEILERRYPVRLRRFELRRGSGGAGRHRGGDGLIREIEFLEGLELSFLGQHRRSGPYGMFGGGGGAAGRQRLVRRDGGVVEIAGIDGRRVEPGDRLILETPGGGGWGSPEEDTP